MKYPHQDLAQQIADYWASPDEANQKIGFVILKSQTLAWVEKDVKELINTTLCLCWDKPELLEFLDFDKRKNEIILRHIKAIDAAEWKEKRRVMIDTVALGSDYKEIMNDWERVVKIGCCRFEIWLSLKYRIDALNIARKITLRLITQSFINNDFSEINQIITKFKGFLTSFVFTKENTFAGVDIYLRDKYNFDFNDVVHTDLIDWRSPSKFAPRLTEYIYNNLDKLAE